MDGMIDSMLAGLLLVFQWPAIGYLMLGVFIGLWMGAVPGLGGIIGLVILLPFTFGMDPAPAFALLLGMYAVTTTSDTISSVMLGIPGTAASQATILDGYPLAKKGQAGRAFGAAFTVSAFGGVVGALIMAVSLPILLPMILSFGVPEFFMLAVLGLAMVGSVSGKSVLKGITVAMLGLLVTTVGYAEASGVPRYHFDNDYMIDGIPIIPIVLGLFALPELLEMAVRNTSISRVPKDQSGDGGLMRGFKDAIKYKWLTARCALLGTYVGMLPGLGLSVVDWIAYGHVVQSSKDKSQFGHGDIRGVIAPEAANNAAKGGALIPTVAFGIPGSLGTAILLGALVIQGLRPGPEMLTDNLDLTFSMVWDIVVANIVAAALLMVLSRQVAKVAFVPGHLIVPGVTVFVLMGSWLATATMGDWWVCLAFGAIGYIMKQGEWPRPPLILALVLGALMEDNLLLSLQLYEDYTWVYTRPIVLIIVALIVITLAIAGLGLFKSKTPPGSQVESQAETQANTQAAIEGSGKNPIFSWPITTILLVLFAWSNLESQQWEYEAQQFPLVISTAAIATTALIFLFDTRDLVRGIRSGGGLGVEISKAVGRADLGRSVQFFGYMLGIVALTFLFGQVVALPIFIAVYLYRWGGYNWKICFGYAACGWVLMYVLYDQIMGIFFHPAIFFG